MKIVKVNDNLKINIDHIYSLEKKTNQKDINNWVNEYNKYIKEFTEDPPELIIDDNKLFVPEFGKVNEKTDLEKYAKALDEYIVSIIDEKPKYEEKYYVILSSGLKININKVIYDSLEKVFEKYYI